MRSFRSFREMLGLMPEAFAEAESQHHARMIDRVSYPAKGVEAAQPVEVQGVSVSDPARHSPELNRFLCESYEALKPVEQRWFPRTNKLFRGMAALTAVMGGAMIYASAYMVAMLSASVPVGMPLGDRPAMPFQVCLDGDPDPNCFGITNPAWAREVVAVRTGAMSTFTAHTDWFNSLNDRGNAGFLIALTPPANPPQYVIVRSEAEANGVLCELVNLNYLIMDGGAPDIRLDREALLKMSVVVVKTAMLSKDRS